MTNLLFKFLSFAKKNGGIEPKKYLSLIPMFLKGTLFYPFTILEFLLYQKKIDVSRLHQDPVFILGYYRSGTTFLQRVLALNPAWANITLLQTVIPECSMTLGKPFLLFSKYFFKIFKIKNAYHKTEFDWNLVGEEDVAVTSMVSEATCYWGFMFPKKVEEYFDRFSYFEGKNKEADIKLWKEEFHKIVKRFNFIFKGQQMLLKSPPNVAKIKELNELYPNAKFIFIYRNPYSVLKSVRRLWEINGKMNFQENPTQEKIDQLTIKDFSHSTDRYFEYKSLIPKDRLFEIKYEDFIADPETTLKNCWRELNLANPDTIQSMVNYVQNHQGEGVTKHRFSDEDYALTEKHLGKYLKLWNYSRP